MHTSRESNLGYVVAPPQVVNKKLGTTMNTKYTIPDSGTSGNSKNTTDVRHDPHVLSHSTSYEVENPTSYV